jgi:hypothetical protein
MQAFSVSGPMRSRMSNRLMADFGLMAILMAAIFAVGCKKSEPAAAAAVPSPVADTNPTPAAMPQAAAAPVVVATSPDGGADLKQLNHAYIGWIIQNRQRPKSFEEYVALSGVQVPPAPAGKKYVIDKNGYINLATN